MGKLTRTLKLGVRGEDVEGFTRAMHRYLQTGQLANYMAQKDRVRQTWGLAKVTLAKKAAKKAGLPAYGVAGPKLEAVMRKADAFDALADHLLDEYRRQHVLPPVVYPLVGAGTVCQGLHPTAGLAGNWAIDFCAPGGTTVVAPVKAKVKKLSGRPPTYVANSTVGIFGWSIHLETSDGYRFFSTHYGTRSVELGQTVPAGGRLGTVGHWPGDPGRSHVHFGVTSPYGTADARKHITAIANAPRLDRV